MQHEQLTPLLLMREELQPKPSKPTTTNRQLSRTTIVSSRLYNEVVGKYYFHGSSYRPASPRPGLLTPPRTVPRAGPSQRAKQRSPINGTSDGSSATPPASVLPNAKAANPVMPTANVFNTLDPDSSEDRWDDQEVIEITSDSDDDIPQLKIPFLVVIWTMVRLYS